MRHHFEVAGIAGLAVGGKVHEFHGIVHYAAVPNLVLETLRAAVQVVGAVVDGQSIFHAVQGKFSLGDAVGEPAGNLTAARAVAKIIGRIFIADGNVFQLSVLVRNHNGHDSRTHAAQLHIGAGSVLEGVQVNLFSVGRSAP